MVQIKFEGSPEEKQSKYCLKNENICKAWGDYISKNEGNLNAKYTAWAIKAKGHLDFRKSWNIEFEKATMTNPSLFDISPDDKPNHGYESMSILCTNYRQNQSFNIYKKSFSDSIKFLFGRKPLEIHEGYILEITKSTNGQESKLLDTLKAEPILYNLESLKYSKEKNQLDLKFDRLLTDFNFLDKIIKANNI